MQSIAPGNGDANEFSHPIAKKARGQQSYVMENDKLGSYTALVKRREVGVELLVPCPLTGRVRASALPAGQVAMTMHWGLYSRLGKAHRAVIDWCAAQGKRTTGTRWEVYGPHNDDPAKLWTQVYWLLAYDAPQ